MKILITESQHQSIKESLDKNKKFLIKTMGVDLTDKIKMITSPEDVPKPFNRHIHFRMIRKYIDFFGPMFLFNLNGKNYLYQERDGDEWFMSTGGTNYVDNEIIEKLGVAQMGLKFSDIINLFYNKEH